MTALVVFGVVFGIGWVMVQTNSEKSRAKWRRRYEPWRPIVAVVRRDVAVCWNELRTFPVRLGDRWRMWKMIRREKHLGT